MFLLGQIGSLAEQQEFKKPDIVGDPAVLQTQSPNGIKIDRSSVSLSNATENTSVEEAEAEKTQSDVGNGLTLLKADLDAVMKKYHLKRKTKVPPVPAIDDLVYIHSFPFPFLFLFLFIFIYLILFSFIKYNTNKNDWLTI